MHIVKAPRGILQIDDARIIWRNFKGPFPLTRIPAFTSSSTTLLWPTTWSLPVGCSSPTTFGSRFLLSTSRSLRNALTSAVFGSRTQLLTPKQKWSLSWKKTAPPTTKLTWMLSPKLVNPYTIGSLSSMALIPHCVASWLLWFRNTAQTTVNLR